MIGKNTGGVQEGGGELEIEEAEKGEDKGRRRKRKRRGETESHNSHTEQNRVQRGTKTHKEQPYDDIYETNREQQSHTEKIVQEMTEYDRDTVIWVALIQGES